jgi:Adenylyl/Guanylyl and SMODS C-terminal sensor domain
MDTVNISLPLAKKALEVEEVEASKIWNQLLGDEFPIIEDTAANHQIKAATFADTWYSPREQFLFRDFGIRNKLERYPISIDCDIEQNGFRRGQLTENSYVSKKCSLTFQIRGLSFIPKSYTIMWKVKNTGQEAAGIGQLRGEITRDQGRGEKHERSLYSGIHYVECYVINHPNECIAKARKYVKIP